MHGRVSLTKDKSQGMGVELPFFHPMPLHRRNELLWQDGSLQTMIDQPATYGRPYPPYVARLQGVLTKLHVVVYQFSRGRFGATLFGIPTLLLTTCGRRTGRLRTAPLFYLPIEDDFVLVASNGGARGHPTWWLNLQAYREAIAQIGPGVGRVQARTATPHERCRFWPLLLQVYPPYARYQARTDRAIPLVILHPIDRQLSQFVPPRYQPMPLKEGW